MSETPRDTDKIVRGADQDRRIDRSVRFAERSATWIMAGTALGLLIFGQIAYSITDGLGPSVDEQILLALRTNSDLSNPIGPLWLEGFMRDVTGLGGFGILSFLVLGVTGFLAATQRRREALEIFAISLSGWLLSHTMKFMFGRPRPELVPHGADVFSSSFPSGHAMVSAVVYLTLATVLARSTSDVRVKVYVIGLALVTTVAVGFSRVYLGVHWPSDVLAGWALGAAWVGVAWIAIRWIEGRAA